MSATQRQQLAAFRRAFVTRAGKETKTQRLLCASNLPALQISDGDKNKKQTTLVSVFTILGLLSEFGGEGNQLLNLNWTVKIGCPGRWSKKLSAFGEWFSGHRA